MNCTHTQILLDAYADHALNAWQTVRVRRHLAGCAVCAAQLANIQHLQASVRAWRSVSAPAALEGRIAVALPRTASAPTPPHNRRVARRAAVGLAGVAAAIGVGFWFLPGHPAQPTVAFADVERAMQQVQTVSWSETIVFHDRADHPVEADSSRATYWLRRNPPALASRWQEQDFQPSLDLRDARGDVMQLAPGRYARLDPKEYGQGGSIARVVEDAVHEITQPQIGSGFAGYAGTDQDESKFSPTQQRRVILDGQERILFVRDQETIIRRRNESPIHYLSHIKLWADPSTLRVVRIEDRPGKSEVITRSDFCYDQPVPSGVFDWSPPPGATVYTGAQAVGMLFYFSRQPISHNPPALPHPSGA